MKKLLTIITDEKPETDGASVPEEVEILHTGDEFSHEVFKAVKGKYAVLAEGDLTCDLTPEFFTALSENNADILQFDGGVCIRASLLKGVPQKYCADKNGTEIFASFLAGSVNKIPLTPFVFTKINETEYSEKEKDLLLCALDEFLKIKSKLKKEVYTFAFDLLCKSITEFYLRAIIAVHFGKLKAENLKEFDAKLKENVILHVTLYKRFPADLQKIRDKDYKVNFLTVNKFKKLLKKS